MSKIMVVTSWFLILALSLGNAFAQAKTTSPEKQAEFKKRVVEWGTNKQVNVKLNSGEKINGRIATIQNEYFEVQSVTKDGKVSTQQINYSNVNKLSAKSSAGKIAGYTTLGVLAAVGVTFIIVFGVILANE